MTYQEKEMAKLCSDHRRERKKKENMKKSKRMKEKSIREESYEEKNIERKSELIMIRDNEYFVLSIQNVLNMFHILLLV